MAESNVVGGLQWVKDEIVTSLQRVLGWLEEFVEREGGQSQLNDAVTALSEVRGLLSGLQLIGPTRLTEEMQTLCEDLQAEFLPNRGEVAEALMLALIQLPDYLDKLGADQADIPMALLPSINDLRGSRGAAPLSEAELLVPASVLAESEMLAADVRRSLGKIAAKVRPHFHRYLLQWLRDEPSRQGLVGLGRLFHRLQRYIGAGIFHELFLVAEAVAEALLDGSIAADTRTKAMIAHLDRVLKSLGADPDAWPEANAQSQLFDLLSLIANSESSSYRVKELRSAYGLEQAAEGGEPVSALAAIPASSRTIGEVPPAGEESGAGAAEPPTPITSVKRIDHEFRDPDRRVAKVIPWPASGRARTEEMGPALDSGEAETEAADEEIAEIATLAEADDALLDIYRSEAREHLAVLRAYCVRGQEDVGPAVPDESVLRALHTLTGSARTTGVLSTARVTAPLERLFQDHRTRDAAPNTSLLEVLGRGIDALEMRLTHIPGYGDEMETLRDLAVDLEERIARLEPGGAADHIPSTEGPGELSEGAFVSRLSEQGGLMSSRLGELDRTLDRLGNQLRDLEIEIEAQIIHRHESDADTLAPGEAGFDPLELDRFSTLQQLVRSLAETVNDLGSLRTQLQDLQGESDTLLQQQAQLAEDL